MHCEKVKYKKIQFQPFIILLIGKRNLGVVDEKTMNYARFPFARAHGLNVSRYTVTNCKMSLGPIFNKFTLYKTNYPHSHTRNRIL